MDTFPFVKCDLWDSVLMQFVEYVRSFKSIFPLGFNNTEIVYEKDELLLLFIAGWYTAPNKSYVISKYWK